MTFGTLLQQSRLAYEKQPNQVEKVANRQLFAEGGHWMAQKMNDLFPQKATSIDHSIPFNGYGFFKYGLCLSAFLMSFCFFAHYNVALIPLSVLVFYFLEIHFVFLFPLLIDKVPTPLWASIKTTYKIGIFKTLVYVLRIAVFMMVGLFYSKNPLKNWHIGCLFIIIWYQHVIVSSFLRNRL